MPNSRAISAPILVSVLWKAGRQCMNLVCGLPVLAITSLVSLATGSVAPRTRSQNSPDDLFQMLFLLQSIDLDPGKIAP
jgi:hypothetical protein